jgi:predicted metallopeptidase
MFKESIPMKETAIKLIGKFEIVAHVNVDSVLFLMNYIDKPKSLARCYSLHGHPIQFFTDVPFCIMAYDRNIDWMTESQFNILILHELMHIPLSGIKLVDHTIKDFRSILGIDLNWSMPGQEVPDILENG